MPSARYSRCAILLAMVMLAGSMSSMLSADENHRPIRVLLLSGQNNHRWQETTPKIKSLLEQTRRFQVHVDSRPDQLTGKRLQDYDVIVSNWNTWGKGPNKITSWPEATRQAYLNFVRAGGGHVVVHAGSSSFADWPEYFELTLATWKLGQTNHRHQHEFEVRIDSPQHPITRGLANFTTHDELWNRPGVWSGAQVIASSHSTTDQGGTGKWEPTALVGRFGQGRCFTLLLGHGAAQMENRGFVTLLVRGTEWAATGQVAGAKGKNQGGGK